MGSAWSTSGKGMKNNQIISPCFDGEFDLDSPVYENIYWKGLSTVYLPVIPDTNIMFEADAKLVKIPHHATIQDFCDLSNISSGFAIDYSESVLFWTCILLSVLVVYVRGYPAKIGLLVAIGLIVYRIRPPVETISWHEASLLSSSLLREATKFSKSLDTFVAPRSTGSDIPGTTKAAVSSVSEVVRLDPGVVVPLHVHSKFTYAVAVTDGLEFTTGSTWTTWKKGSLLGVPPGLSHTVRASSSAMFVSFHPTGALKDI